MIMDNVLDQFKDKGTNRNGDIIARMTFKDNLIEGKRTDYYLNGKISRIDNYSKGKKNGETLIYDEVGNLLKRIQYKDDNLDGKLTEYYSNGNVKCIYNYKKDKADGEFVTYFIDGKIDTKGKYVDNYYDGTIQIGRAHV